MSRYTLSEKTFEDSIVDHLVKKSGISQRHSDNFNKATGFIDADVVHWVKTQYPEIYQKYEKDYREKASERLIKDVRANIDNENFGTLGVLRKGIYLCGEEIKMMGLPDIAGKNSVISKRFKANKLSFVRQLVIDQYNRSIDIVFFLNGICIFTWELKSTEKQSVKAAIEQYKSSDRDPSISPILKPLTGALGHFAISNEYVYMTTALKRENTDFIPFNIGTPQGGENPANPNGFATSYLWEDVFTRKNLLELIADYLFIENGALVFPRYHQWKCVEQMKSNSSLFVSSNQKKNRFLIQHSPGSGKTKTISWMAHHLSRLHVDNTKAFDSVILVTDRKMLDNQLKEAIKNFEKSEHFAHASKSKKLFQLVANKENIITTLHKFSHAFKGIKKSVKNGRVAVIIDEAHSSQDGQMANEMLEKISENIGDNIAIYAFTATPTERTLQVFGKPDDVYSMRQAIAEGFIIDVLRNINFNTFAFNASIDDQFNSEEVDAKYFKGEFFKRVMRSEKMIGHKTLHILHHFKHQVLPSAPWAKAMIVASDIQAAIAYKLVMDEVIKAENYVFKTLISYSGKSNLPEMGLNDLTLSSNLSGAGFLKNDDAWIRETFNKDDYQFLIVVDKYTTGFDQPKLMAMYIDQKISGVKLVQTINRLNRKYPKKSHANVSIIDLCGNTPDQYKESVEPYYGETNIQGVDDILETMKVARAELDKYGLSNDIVDQFNKASCRKGFLSGFKQQLVTKHKQHIYVIVRLISFYLANYYYAINVGYQKEHDFRNFNERLKKYLSEFCEQNYSDNQNEALNSTVVDSVTHVKSEIMDLSPDKDGLITGKEVGVNGKSLTSEKKTIAECINDINEKMLEILEKHSIKIKDDDWRISDIYLSLSENDRTELRVNDVIDLLEDSDVLNSIKDFARKKGVSNVNIFSTSIVPLIKSNIDIFI